MEVTCSNPRLLTDYEVLALLKKQNAQSAKDTKTAKKLQNLNTLNHEIRTLFAGSSTSVQTPESIAAFLEAMKPFKLTDHELLQLMNSRVTNSCHLRLVLTRCSTAEQDEIVQACLATLIALPEEEEMLE